MKGKLRINENEEFELVRINNTYNIDNEIREKVGDIIHIRVLIDGKVLFDKKGEAFEFCRLCKIHNNELCTDLYNNLNKIINQDIEIYIDTLKKSSYRHNENRSYRVTYDREGNKLYWANWTAYVRLHDVIDCDEEDYISYLEYVREH